MPELTLSLARPVCPVTRRPIWYISRLLRATLKKGTTWNQTKIYTQCDHTESIKDNNIRSVVPLEMTPQDSVCVVNFTQFHSATNWGWHRVKLLLSDLNVFSRVGSFGERRFFNSWKKWIQWIHDDAWLKTIALNKDEADNIQPVH